MDRHRIIPARILISFCIAVLLHASAWAGTERDPADINTGMNYKDVLTVWGSPKEKIEYEARREDLWLYKETTVRFKEGKVISAAYRPRYAELHEQRIKIKDSFATDYDAQSQLGAEEGVVEDILSEIMEKTSSGEKEESSKTTRVGAFKRLDK